ncbi:MAG TPA: rhomboid family intramembrane serine protease [Bacillota bacterium]|nr:rhomboid family intramembrane serine protease [Bacillota bacterium]
MFPLRDSNPSRRWPIMTVLLIGINLYVFYRQTGLSPEGYNRFVGNFGLFPLDFTKALLQDRLEITALFSYMFLHGGLFHLISNMWALWLFGDNVEDRMGPLRFLCFYLLAGWVSGLAHIYFNPYSPVPTIGASGAIAGVMGAYLLMYPTAKIVTFVPIFFIPWFINIPALIYLAFWFFLQIHSALASQGSTAASGVAWWAHVGGFLVGMVSFPFFIKSRR